MSKSASIYCLVLLAASLAPSEGFLGRGTLLENKGDIFNIYCKGFDKSTTVWHHREITREAVRRVVVKYFKEVPPSEGVYNHRDGMTLEEVYKEYYGSKASPQPFLHALANLVDAAASADSGILGADPRYHFGSERFSESQQLLGGRWRRIVQAGQAGDYSAALYMLGLSLAGIQDFYSHTNWLEIGNKKFNPRVGLPGMDFENVAKPREETCKECASSSSSSSSSSCKDNLLQDVIDLMKLTSGYSEGSSVNGIRLDKPRNLGKCSHGGSKDRSFGADGRGGINKELPTSCFSPHHYLHYQAAEEAIQASEYYLNLVRGAIGDAMFSRMMSLHPTPSLVLVLDTTDSMDQELSALTHVASNLLEKHSRATYPPAEYLLVPFNDPFFAGQVTRSQRPDEVYEALKKLRATGGGDEAEYSMSALRLAIHYAPSYSHVFLITDASIKDLELFDTVIAMAQEKKIQVIPVLTMPVIYGGILGRSDLSEAFLEDYEVAKEEEESFRNREKRQLSSYGKYLELSQRTGGQVIETPSDLVEETSKIFEAEQYPMVGQALIWREVEVRYPKEVKFPVDSLISEFEVSISGGTNSAYLFSPTGIRYDLGLQKPPSDQQELTVVATTPFLIQVRLNMTQRPSDVGQWTLNMDPSSVISSSVFARTSMDISPTFYRPDFESNQPSLQRIMGQPGKGMETYLDVVVTGVDTAGLRSVQSVLLQGPSGEKLITLDLPTTSPRRNTYLDLPTDRLKAGKFSVVVVGKDDGGHPFRRESSTIWEVSESFLEFQWGQEIWGHPGQNLTIPVSIRNTNNVSSNTFFMAAHEAKGAHVGLSQSRVSLGPTKSQNLYLYVTIPRNTLPSTTSTLVVTATSIRGDTSYTLAHLVVTPQEKPRLMKRNARYNSHYDDQSPPTITESGRTSCSGYLSPQNCNHQWSVRFQIQDLYPGLLKVTLSPDTFQVPPFDSGRQTLDVYYSSTCCQPTATIYAYDLALNVNSKTVDNKADSSELSAGAVSGIVLGSVAAVALLLLLVVLIARRCKNSKKEHVALRRTRRRTSSSE